MILFSLRVVSGDDKIILRGMVLNLFLEKNENSIFLQYYRFFLGWAMSFLEWAFITEDSQRLMAEIV